MELGEYWSSLFSPPLMLALVATIGYLVGRKRLAAENDDRAKNRNEIARALSVAQELESITHRLRKSLASHVPAVAKFNSKVARLEQSDNLGWHDLCDKANELLKPALRLSNEISNAHAAILQQMQQLSLFAELRTDPLTGAANRRAFDDSIDTLVKEFNRYGAPVSVAMLDIDHFKQVNDEHGHLQGDVVLRDLAELLRDSLRECDIVARYGGEEFAIIMPQTKLAPAAMLGQRLRAKVEENLPITVSIGLAEMTAGGTATTIVQRADAAMYQAKVNGRNQVYVHEGANGPITDGPTFSARNVVPLPLAEETHPEADAEEATGHSLTTCHD
jgi:diguanylate cyclase (GGDEF)-like protein